MVDHKFLYEEKKISKNSILLKNEVVNAIFEYDSSQMIVSLAMTDLLIVKDWNPVKLILRNSAANINKFCFMALPGFNVKTYPFVICSGFEHISIINVKECFMQCFIKEPCYSVRGQQVFFFKKEKYGHSLHFASKYREGKGEQHKWHSLQLKQDFKDYMIKFGRLPVHQLSEKSQIEQELEEYKKIESTLFSNDLRKRGPLAESRPTSKFEKMISVAMNKKPSIQSDF